MKLFDTREEASKVVNSVLSRYAEGAPHASNSIRLAKKTYRHTDDYQVFSFVLKAANGDHSLLRLMPPILYDVPTGGAIVTAPMVHLEHDLFIEKTSRTIPPSERRRGDKKSKTVYSTPIIWPDGKGYPTTRNIDPSLMGAITRPEPIRARFRDERLAVLPSEIAVGDQLNVQLYLPDAYPLEEVWSPYFPSKERVVRIEDKDPQPVTLGTVVGISLRNAQWE